VWLKPHGNQLVVLDLLVEGAPVLSTRKQPILGTSTVGMP
jgi:beta-galactosidase